MQDAKYDSGTLHEHDNKQLRRLSLSKYLYMDVSDKDRAVDDDSVEEDVVLYMLLKALYKCMFFT